MRAVIQFIFIALFFAATQQAALAEKRTLNMKDADIRALISQVADVTGYNFIVDPRVKGNVTVVSSRPMDAAEIYQVFLSILRVHGYSAVRTDNVVKIIPESQAKQSDIPADDNYQAKAGDEMVTRVLQVKSATATQLIPILRPLVPQYGHLAAYAPTNVVIISDRASNIERLVNIIRRIDKASTQDIEVIPLRHASAVEVVRLMQNLEKNTGQTDKGSKGARMAADERTNSVLLTGEEAARARLKGLILELDTPLEASGNTRVTYLKYAKATDMVPILEGISGTLSEEQTVAGGEGPDEAVVMIQADEATNALIISAPPDVQRAMQRVIAQLDIRRAQVLVEAVIVEIQDNKIKELGVQWALRDNKGLIGGAQFNNLSSEAVGNVADRILAFNQEDKVGEDGFFSKILGVGASLGIGRIDFTDDFSLAVLIRALANRVEANILSTPTLMTLDNVEAEIKVGQKVPFVTGNFTTDVDGGNNNNVGNPFQTIQREDVGITLRVTPFINEGGAITLEIEQEVSDIAQDVVASDIVTNNKTIKTTVLVDDTETIVLGGLIDDKIRETFQKVPILGDLPLIGGLFRSKATTRDRNNLMVFLRPTILRDEQTQRTVSQNKYNALRALQKAEQVKGIQLMPDEQVPLLPHWGETLTLPPTFDAYQAYETTGEEPTEYK